MIEVTNFLRWLIEYAISGGFWHFVAVVWIVDAIAKVTTLVSVRSTVTNRKDKDD